VGQTVQTRLEQYVSVKDFGAVGDGVTDDTAAIQSALNTGKSVFIPDGSFYFTLPLRYTADDQTIFGHGNTSILKHRGTGIAGPSWISTDGRNNVSLLDLQIDGGSGVTAANPGLYILGGSKNVSVGNVFFNGGNQVVYLATCSNIKVVNNTFDGCGYGVIQRINHVSSYVLIDGNVCLNSVQDFVEANCASSAPSEHWVVSNNTYDTAAQYPTPITEGRFAGITSVRGVVITGNTITKAAGDAAIHLEDTLGDTIIANNVFDNCLTSGGINAYISILNTAENTIISGNIFLRTDATLPAAIAVETNSNVYSNTMILADNLIRGGGASANMGGFNLGFQDQNSALTCTGNIFQDIVTGISLNGTYNTVIANNAFLRCQTPVTSGSGNTLSGLINSNNFIDTVGAADIVFAGSQRLDVQNNKFGKTVDLGTCTDVFVNDNTFSASASLVGPVGTRAFAPTNVYQSLGYTQARYDNIGNTRTLKASKAATNIGGSASTTFTITCAATGAVWQPGTIKINAAANDANVGGLAAAWWLYRFSVLTSGIFLTQGLADSGGTVGSFSVSLTNASATASTVTFDVVVTATNLDLCTVDLECSSFASVNSIV
jgi:hypothetical protein